MCKIIVMLFESYVPPALVFVQLLIGICLARTHPQHSTTVLDLRFQQCREGCLKKVNLTFGDCMFICTVQLQSFAVVMKDFWLYAMIPRRPYILISITCSLNTNIMFFCTFVKCLKSYSQFEIFNGSNVYAVLYFCRSPLSVCSYFCFS